METKVLQDLRTQLAEAGYEMTLDAVQEILQAAAHIASLVGGAVYLETPAGWGAEVGLGIEDPEQAWVDIYLLEDDPDEEMN